jgi:hypothetical protein
MSRPLATLAADERMFCAIVSEADQRQHSRRPTGALARLRRVVAGEELGMLDVLVRDVSVHGIGIHSPVRLEAGSTHRLELGGSTEPVLIQVIHCRRRFDGTYDTGARAIA